MEFKTKKLFSTVVICSYLFLGGVEFAVILPTAWEYLQSIGVTEEALLGVTVAGYSLSAAISGIFGGRFADKYPDKTKFLCMFCIVIMVIGNLQYMIGFNVWNIVISRFVCGIGTGAGAAMLAYVCRTTTVHERTAILSMCNASRQIGILIGPAFQLFLTGLDFNIGEIHVSKLNAAGLFMAVLWTIFIFVCAFMFHDITEEYQQMLRDTRNSQNGIGRQMQREMSTNSLRTLSICESISVSPPEKIGLKRYSKEIIQDTVICLMGSVFTVFFGQILIETLVPLYMIDYFGLTDVETSLVYMIGGLECLLLLILIMWLSKYVPDWLINLFGLLFILVGFSILAATLPYYEKGDISNLVPFIIANIVIGAGYPLSNVANTALTSKCLSMEAQGFGHGLRRFMSYIGLVLGPLWAGATARYPSVMMGVTMFLVVFNLLIYLDVLPRMIKAERKAVQSHLNESTPLLAQNARHNSWTSTQSLSEEEDEGITFV